MLSLAAASPANGDSGTTICPANSATISPAAIAEPTVSPSAVAEAAVAPAAIAPAAPTAIAPATTVPPVAGKELLLRMLELVKIQRIHALLESQARIRFNENAGRGSLLKRGAGGHQREQTEKGTFEFQDDFDE